MTDHDNTRLDALIAERDAAAEAAPPDARPPDFSEEALALDFAAAQAARLRFVAAWNRWMVWDGMRWRTDDTRAATDLARPLCRHAASVCNWDALRRTLASARTVNAVTALAATDRRLAATVDEWDTDPWALNTPDGVVDLKTGEIRDHDPAQRITKVTAVGIDRAAVDLAHGHSAPAARASAGAGPGPARGRACLPLVGDQTHTAALREAAGEPSLPSSCAGLTRASHTERSKRDPRVKPGDDAWKDAPARQPPSSPSTEPPLRAKRGKRDCAPPGQGAPAEAGASAPNSRERSGSEWHRFLARVTGGDKDLAAFLQRMAGYALTGSTEAHALFFLYGTGANGKSVFTSTLAGIMGDYHRTAPIETFTASATDRHPTELAALRGARLVTASETHEGRRWAESRIKALTGGEAIAARYMRQDFFEYVPQFKLVIAGNHKPGLSAVDEAIRRRFHLVPFEVTIPAHERDPNLAEKLKAEWPEILAWAIEGCLEWQRSGLNPPKAVVAATSAYLEAQDAVGAWADECCAKDADAFELTAELYANWTRWAQKAGEPAGNRKRFVDALVSRGLDSHRRSAGVGFVGLRLKPSYDPDEYWRR